MTDAALDVTLQDLHEFYQDTRKYLDVKQNQGVPRNELLQTATAHGWNKQRVEKALQKAARNNEFERTDNGGIKPSEVNHEEPKPNAENPGCNAAENQQNHFTAVDFSETETDVYPATLIERRQWMARKDKLPYAPWGQRNHPDVEQNDGDDRYKWSIRDNYITGTEVKKAEIDPEVDGRVFIQLDKDPYLFVDGDDVRCPKTGDVHPEFKQLLDRLGATYVDISQSGSGVHANYRGDIPGSQGQAVYQLDDQPWGENTDPPTVEIYSNKHVCVATGQHVKNTPRDVQDVDRDALKQILKRNDAWKNKQNPCHDTDKTREELEDYEPKATDVNETTTEIKDIVAAVDRLTPRDLPLKTRQVDTENSGWTKWDPSSYRTSSGNDSLHKPPNDPIFHDHKHNESFGVLSLYAAENGVINKPWEGLEGKDWWRAVEQARQSGAPIPEYINNDDDVDVEYDAVIDTRRDLTTAASGWDWRHTAKQTNTISIEQARNRTVDAIADAYRSNNQVLIEALPTMGKTYGSVEAAQTTQEPVTILTGRGRKEQYSQLKEWCKQQGLSYLTLPSFTHDCSTANGTHGKEWKEKVRDWYRRGATPQQIHAIAHSKGNPLPCQQDGECPYSTKWSFDPDNYDVLIGHYNHAYKQKVTTARTVVFDEFPDAYENELLEGKLQDAVSVWLQTKPEIPYNSYVDLIENRDNQERRMEALEWFDNHTLEPDERHVFNNNQAHADTPYAVYTILAGEDLGNGFEQTTIPDVGVGVHNKTTGTVSILQPPNLTYTSGVVALDGTPTKKMWELSLGVTLNHRQVLQDNERTEYIQDALNVNLVKTTDYVKPYNSSDHVNVQQDAALLQEIRERHSQKPCVITSRTAELEYREHGDVVSHVDETRHYGNVLGSNEFDDVRVGAVIGSNHYGDHYIQKWGAYNGDPVTRRSDGKGGDLTYTGFGDDVLTHMREHETLQAAMRFGRDGNGAVVYIHTNTLPSWVPVAGEGRVVKTWSDGMRDVVEALKDLTAASTKDVVEHPGVELSRQQVFDHLETLRSRGVLQRRQDSEDGRRFVWRDDGLHRIGEHGDVELDTVELQELSDEEVRQLARNSIYTWEFTNRGGCGVDPGGSLDVSTSGGVGDGGGGVDPPPYHAD